jgi:hypothetical protein
MNKLSTLRGLLLLALFLAGCGSGFDESISGSPNGEGARPPGTVLANNTGPVFSEQDAILRFLEIYVGSGDVNRSGILPREVRVGTDGTPIVNAYILPGGPFEPGTRVTEADLLEGGYDLEQFYYLFWVDPNPFANLGHDCSIVYLRASDGLMVEQVVDFDPVVGGARLLEFDQDKIDGLIYTHRFWRDLGFAPGQPASVSRAIPQVHAQGVGQPGGPAIGGLGVSGAPEARRAADLAAGRDLFESMGGEPGDFKTLVDTENDRATVDDLKTALAAASKDLGPADKFLFVLSSHGSTDGKFCLGKTQVRWQDLCALLEGNVSAGNINLVIDTCYAGTAIPAFAEWSGKRIKVVTSCGGTPSYSRPDGLGINLECIIEELKALIAAAGGDGTLTLAELEKAMGDVDVTDEEIDKKICDFIGDVPGAVLHPDDRAWKDDYLNDIGAKDKVKRSSGSKTGGSSPPNPLGEFLIDWSQQLAAEDVGGLTPFYVPNFIYDGKNVSQINRLDSPVDIQIRSLQLRSFQPFGDSFFDLTFELQLAVALAGPPAISQTEDQIVRMRVKEGVGAHGFQIQTQQTLSQSTTGTLGLPPLAIPPLPTFQALTITGPGGAISPGDPISPGDQVQVQVSLPDFSPSSGSAGVVFGGQFLTLQPTGGGNYASSPFNVPVLAPGYFVFDVFAETRTVGVPGLQESYAGRSQTLEVSVGAP